MGPVRMCSMSGDRNSQRGNANRAHLPADERRARAVIDGKEQAGSIGRPRWLAALADHLWVRVRFGDRLGVNQVEAVDTGAVGDHLPVRTPGRVILVNI